MKVLITGGTGLIGRSICKRLLTLNHEPIILSRNPNKDQEIKEFQWNPEKNEYDKNAFEDIDAIINLAGCSINAKRWTHTYKNEILQSRLNAIATLQKALVECKSKCKIFISTSAVGIYGSSYDKLFTEESGAAKDFLAKVCIKWEEAIRPIEAIGIATTIIRTGVVLSNKGGAFPIMAKPFRLGLGSPIGNGKQFMPWIHIGDLSSIFIYVLENSLTGTFNGVAPNSITNREFSKKLSKKLKRPILLPNVPQLVLKLMLGESAILPLASSRVSSNKITDQGFEFMYNTIESCLDDIL